MGATARWLERYVRASCARPEKKVVFEGWRADDAGTLLSLVELLGPLARVSEEAGMARGMAEALLGACDRNGRLPAGRRREVGMLIEALESRLA